MKKIAVFCGASIGFSEEYEKAAVALGQYLVKNKICMIYGGGKVGMMGAIADTMLKLGGEIVGVIPELLHQEEVAHNKITQMLISKNMSERKVTISKLVDGYIAMPGGYGTLDEIFEALTLGQLNIEQKPVGLLNTNGYFNHLLKQLDHMVTEGFLRTENREMLLVSDTVEDLFQQMHVYQAPKVSKLVHTTVNRQTR